VELLRRDAAVGPARRTYEAHNLLGNRLCDPVTHHHTERCVSNEVPIKGADRDTANIFMKAVDSRALRITTTLDLTCQPDDYLHGWHAPRHPIRSARGCRVDLHDTREHGVEQQVQLAPGAGPAGRLLDALAQGPQEHITFSARSGHRSDRGQADHGET